MDRALDEVISERQRSNRGAGGSGGGGRGGGSGGRRDNGRDTGRGRDRDYDRDYDRERDRDWTRKNDRNPANLDNEWIHDKYDEDEDDGSRRPSHRPRPARQGRSPAGDDIFGRDRDRGAERNRDRDRDQGTKIRVENLHWDLNEDDLTGLFERIGPISRLNIDYDRSGRSTGVAYVTYPDPLDARDAVRQFDGANAKGQPIRLTVMSAGAGSRGGRNPFDTVQAPVKSLIDRIDGRRDENGGASRSRNRERNRSRSPGAKRADLRATMPQDIDRYIPGDRSRSRSPRRRTGNDRPGRRDRRTPRTDDRVQQQQQHQQQSNGRPRRTQEELDRDMDDYFKTAQTGGSGPTTAATGAATGETAAADADIDMIE